MSSPRVLVVLNTAAAWSRGILLGFMAKAHERGWTLLHYEPGSDLTWLREEWKPEAAVVGPELDRKALTQLGSAALVSVTVDRSADGIPSVCLDEDGIARHAAEHLLATGLRDFTTFRFDESAFARARERTFLDQVRAAKARIAESWGGEHATLEERGEKPAAIRAWLAGLPKPCGIFTCTDGWARTVARYARVEGLRIPEDIALVGADNDVLECELIAPPLSSVMIPWTEVGKHAADLVRRALAGRAVAGQRAVVQSVGVMARRSSDVLAIDDPLVAAAVRFIVSNASRRLTVTMVARGVGSGRQRLERRFRQVLDRTVQEEIRRAHVEAAKRLLATTRSSLAEVAKQSGFTNAALLNTAFQRELGMPPGVYRRRVQRAVGEPDAS